MMACGSGVPLQAIFFIHHADQDVASFKPGIDAVESLLAQTFSTFYDGAAMECTLDFCSQLGRTVPAYDLGFMPTPEVVRYVLDRGWER